MFGDIERALATDPVVATLIAATATQLSATKTAAKRGILISADPHNNEAIFIGNSHQVTDAQKWMACVTSTGGPVTIPISDASNLWVYTTGVGQKFGWAAI